MQVAVLRHGSTKGRTYFQNCQGRKTTNTETKIKQEAKIQVQEERNIHRDRDRLIEIDRGRKRDKLKWKQIDKFNLIYEARQKTDRQSKENYIRTRQRQR